MGVSRSAESFFTHTEERWETRRNAMIIIIIIIKV